MISHLQFKCILAYVGNPLDALYSTQCNIADAIIFEIESYGLLNLSCYLKVLSSHDIHLIDTLTILLHHI
jgi:hypothetical protein